MSDPSRTIVRPASFASRSFLYRRLEAAGARFTDVGGTAVAMDFHDEISELKVAKRLAIADLSPLPRVGFKGPDTMTWLTNNGVLIDGSKPNWSWRQNDGALAITRSPNEALILTALSTKSDLCAQLESKSYKSMETRTYILPRYHGLFWFVLTGSDASACIAKMCGVDLRTSAFPNSSVAQSSMARVSTIVVRADLGSTNTYHLLGDSASAEYFWDAMRDAMSEFAGGLVGLSSVQSLDPDFK